MNEMLIGGGALRVEDFSRDGHHTWVVAGRLDRRSAPAFPAMAAQLCAQGARSLVVELGELTQLDASGLAAIVQARRVCEAGGCSFALSPLSRVLSLPRRRRQAQREATVTGLRTRRQAPSGQRAGASAHNGGRQRSLGVAR
jgi:anti-anti-sigma factor